MGRKLSIPRQREGGTTRIQKLAHPLEVLTSPVPGAVLAVDQGLTITGFGFMRENTITEHGILKLPGKSHHQKAEKLKSAFSDLLDQFQPDLVLFESGGMYGGAMTPEAKRGIIISEYVVAHECYLRQISAKHILNTDLKYALADMARIKELKRLGHRKDLRPVKEDVIHAVKAYWKLPDDFFFSPDHCDVLALLLAYAKSPALAKPG